ncbi:winged helix-turn-helix domain-containing protein [Dyadobacter crusticola]|uniref:winged helix-turn-helix domain-containing protein n=1 Tax=Dyadobacter crusticola TaxID=292407 RepID=UPI0004E1DD52|nr:winged helix-turn-helix domain-containing protein [Dyadobacter crusticola]
MTNTGNKSVFPFKLLFFAALLALLPAFQTVSANNENVRFAEKANLALRRAAHHLLLAAGDSVTTIPAVKQIDANTFSVRVENLGEYEKLPKLLQESLQTQNIGRGYNVMVFNCETSELQLGYNFQDLTQKGGVACENRDNEKGCFTLQVSFDPLPQNAASNSGIQLWIIPFACGLAGIGLFVWNRNKQKLHLPKTEAAAIQTSEIYFGNSSLDSQNLILVCGNAKSQLTYREAKLLSLFVRNSNQVLERDFILKSVWEDEGIIVSRSVDVFVSRLRKLLAPDPAVKITAIHGVGYKMEIHS